MAFFKSQEEKEQEQLERFRSKFHIDSLSPEDLEIVQKVASDLAGKGLMKFGLALSFSNSDAMRVQIDYLSALTEQNWLIIKQLSQLNQNIEKLLNK